jgi:hypothetical protein
MSAPRPEAVRPLTYPARPINGGPLEWAPPKPGPWCYEPKYNAGVRWSMRPRGRCSTVAASL